MTSLADFLSTPVGIIVAVLVAVVVIVAVWFAVKTLRSKKSDETPRESAPLEQASPPPKAPEAAAPAETMPTPVAEVEVEEEPQVTEEVVVDVPERAATRMGRLRARMASSGAIGNALLSIFARGDLSAADWEEIEETLLLADVGLGPTEEIMGQLQKEAKIRGGLDADAARQVLREKLLELVSSDASRELDLSKPELEGDQVGPASVLVVGVNGTGKTTTVGKLARLLTAEDQQVLLGAADTFRAAATEQLTTWADRVGVPVVSSDREGADPASVAFEAVKTGKEQGSDVVIVDTAGRLQTKATLMDELGKIRRVMEKQSPLNEILLVLDATTGQNGMRQAEVFAEAVGITGIILTKLDGSAKGGIVFAVQKELGVPVKLVGLGEGPDDLAPFDPEAFVDAIVGE